MHSARISADAHLDEEVTALFPTSRTLSAARHPCYTASMNITTNITLDEAVAAAKELPEDAQAELAMELMERVEDVLVPERPAPRQALIRERLSRPFEPISRDELTAMLRRYNPSI
jgi:hypothetical protein